MTCFSLDAWDHTLYIVWYGLTMMMMKFKLSFINNRSSRSKRLIFYRKFRFFWWWSSILRSSRKFFLNLFYRYLYMDRRSFCRAIRIWSRFDGIMQLSMIFRLDNWKKSIRKGDDFSVSKCLYVHVGWPVELFLMGVVENLFFCRLRPTAALLDYPLLRYCEITVTTG